MPKPNSKPLLIYTTFGNVTDAERIGEVLVRERLAACVNIGAPMRSIYEWDDRIDTSDEVPALIKSVERRRDALIERLEGLHPYDTPAILVLDVEEAAPAFAAWLDAQTAPGRETAGG